MGLVHAEIEWLKGLDAALCNAGRLEEVAVKKIKVVAMVDSGAYMLAVNEDIQIQLDLRKVDEQEAEFADGRKSKLDIVGPVDIRFKNRATTVRAMVLPGDSQVLLGAIPMEDMDVVIDPRKQELIVNPSSPYMAKKSLK